MEIHIDSFLIEATRRCNLKCAHCCRGDAQSKDLETHKFNMFLDKVSRISTLTVGGGEPSLNISKLEDIKQALSWRSTEIQNLYLVTNGKRNISNLTEWFLNTIESCITDNEISGIGFSFDTWHNEAMYGANKDNRLSNFHIAQEEFMNRGYEDNISKHSDERWSYDSLLKMGRSKYSGNREVTPDTIEIEEYNDSIYLSETDFYMTYDGMIFSNCNLSYEEMTKNSLFYICDYNDDLYECVKSYNAKIENL